MHNSSLDLNLGQHSNNNNFNINHNNNNNSNLSTSTSDSNDNECIFNCSNTKVLLIPNDNNNNNNNNNTKTGRQMMAAQEKKTADGDERVENATNTSGGGVIVGVVKTHNRDDIMYNAEQETRQTAGGGLRVTSGILVDESASYETDEESERMQLNPSDDEGWDDEYDDDDDEDADEAEMDDEDDTLEDEDEDADAPYIGSAATVNVAAQARSSATFEALPEAKGLVQALVDDENESVKNMPDILKTKSISAAVSKIEDEEEDMGFDEDDERIAIIVERQRGNANEHDKGFMNEEGSGAGGGAYRRTEANRYKNNNRFRLDYTEKYRRKQQKLQTEYTNRGVADAREGSGNFANDNDDDDDDDSDDDDVDADDDDADDDGVDDAAIANSNADANDDADRQEGDGYFNSKHTKSSNRYFRKNTNDAIKIISTPLGKVGIVYQQTPTNEDGNNSNNNANSNNKKQDTLGDKKTSSFTDFDALSPDPESSHRLASSHPKITPVLTPDGKVALLYRGDSENSKYEPIRNLTHKFNNNNNNKNDFTDNKAIASGTSTKDTPDFPNNDGSEDESADESEDDYDLDNDSSSNSGGNDRTQPNGRKTNANPTDETQKAAIQNPATDADTPAAAGGSFIIRPTDSVLPMINRPLSEVLGIKKNQFKQFRIKDIPTAPPNSETAGDPRSLAGTSIDRTLDTTTLHFLTKVNLAEYPTSMKTRNFDFDFSRDNTMLDERSRHKEHQFHQQQGGSGATAGGTAGGESGNSNNKLNTIANEEVLAKTEVVNLAIIPHFDEELERLQRMREHETRRHYRQRYRQKPSEEELSGIHCIMQAMMGIAAISTVFGMLGTFFKQRILDQIRLMHW